MHSSVSIYIYILVNELPSRVAVLIHIFLLCTDTFIQKTRKLYLDTRTQRNLSKLNDDLFEVQQIMTRNIQEVLGVGDRLDRMSLNSVHQIVVLPYCLRLDCENGLGPSCFTSRQKP
jgi:hypothetical protein